MVLIKSSFLARSNFININESFVSPLTQNSFHRNLRNTTKKLWGWSGTWKRSCPWILGSMLILILPFLADNQWPSAHAWNNSYPQLILEKNKLLPLSQLLKNSEKYHQQLIRVRGQVTRLELHLDETKYFIDFVFFLKDGKERVLVFGRHDRTKGDIQLTSDHMVEVRGRFWKERIANGHRLINNLEAHQVMFYPPKKPNHAKRFSLPKDYLVILKDKTL